MLRVVVGLAILVSIFAATALAQSLQEQKMCAKQAHVAFQYWKRGGKEEITGSDDYKDHFNTRLKKCLVLIESRGSLSGEYFNSALLMDAYESRVFAGYSWSSRKGKKYWEVPPLVCQLMPISEEKTECSSREEFDAFVAKYMEE